VLNWNEFEFIECLGVLPEVGDDGVHHSFCVDKDGMSLIVTVFQYDADVYIDIHKDGIEPPIFSTQIKASTGARYIKYPNGTEFLEIAAPCKYNSDHEDNWIVPMGARISVNPHISVEMFQP
jgi:hypothetical protein